MRGQNSIDLDFVCVGPQRTGSTWLDQMLRQHPRLCLPRPVKETMYFDRRFERGGEWYANYFEHCSEVARCGEVAPTYFDSTQVPERIHDVSPSCMVFVGIRHPAERAFSLYLHHLRKGRVSGSFWEAVEQKPRIVTSGDYAVHLRRWEAAFGEERVHCIFLDDIGTRPEHVVDTVCSRLGVEPLDDWEGTREKVYATSMPRCPALARATAYLTTRLHSHGLHRVVEWGKKLGIRGLAFAGGEDDMPELTEADRRRLVERYADDIAYVEDFTGRDLSAWTGKTGRWRGQGDR